MRIKLGLKFAQTAWTQGIIAARALSFHDFKTIACAAHGFQILRLLRVLLNFFAQLSYVNIHRTRADEGGIAAYRIKQLVEGKNSAWTLRQIMEQPEFGSGGDGRSAALVNRYGRLSD